MPKQSLVSAAYIDTLLHKRLAQGQPVSHRMIAVAASLAPSPQHHRARLEAAMARRLTRPATAK